MMADAAVAQQAYSELNGASEYPRFQAVMDQWGYDWESHQVTTDDDYILTTFHVLGKKGSSKKATEGSVLIQHGDFEDGTSMMEQFDGAPFHLLLVDAGYDVWIGNNRGTQYSWGHKTLKASDPLYWDWTWAQMGLYDDTANITKIRNENGGDKVFYIGYSQGTVQMHYGLAHLESSFHADNVHKVVQIAPCFVPHVPNWTISFAN
jgi:lysosomal acid lipase/cholesteryl ester hydrolase